MKTFIASGIAAASLVSAASADITVTLTNQTFTGFQFSQFVDYTQFNIVGTLTGASINATLDASVNYTYADDLCVYVDVEPLSTAGKLQIGGFSNLSAAQRYSWPNGGSSAPGTTSIGSVSLTTALVFTGDKAVDGTVWIGNGYGASGTSGTWSGTVTLIGVNAVAVPAPGALALLGLAGFASRRRRA
jgi:MYXO-CTERM domain-containing protein